MYTEPPVTTFVVVTDVAIFLPPPFFVDGFSGATGAGFFVVGFFAIFICLYIKYKEKKSKNQIYGEIFFQTKLTLRCPCHTSKNPDKIDHVQVSVIRPKN
jgi:hypothetical protein